MKKLLFGCLGIFLLLTILAACTPEIAPAVPAPEAVAEESISEIEPTTAPTPTDLPAPRVETEEPSEPTAVATAEEATAIPPEPTSEAEAVTEVTIEEGENENEGEDESEPDADTVEPPNEPFYGRTAEGAFTIGYNSAPVKIIEYSDFL